MDEEVVFDTPWFQLVAKRPPSWNSPHYSIRTHDYVCVVAVPAEGGLLLVRQYRPAVAASCLELPGGHVDPGESPEESARRELLEETGYRAERLELLGWLAPDVGRLGNRMWCYYAEGVVPVAGHQPESGIESICYSRSLQGLLNEPDFNHALHLAALLLAVSKGHLTVGPSGEEVRS
jgi:8-oxo-dGTP pyrophosphatase MutT (NUDIX family)